MPLTLASRALPALPLLVPSLIAAQAGSAPGTRDSLPAAGVAAVSPLVRSERSYRIVVASAPVAAGLDAQPALYAMQTGCRGAAPSELPSRERSTAASLDRVVALVAVPGSAATQGCELRWDTGALAVWNGLSFARTAADEPLPTRVSLMVGGDTVAALRSTRDTAFAVGRGGWIGAGERLRYDFPLDAFAPRTDGWPEIRFLVWHAGGGYAPVDMNDTTRQLLAANYLAARAVGERGSEGAPVKLLPRAAIHPAVQQALYSAAAGRIGQAAVQAVDALGDRAFAPSSSSSDGVAQLLLAEAFAARGDDALAGALVEAARAGHPCLRAPAGSSPAVSALVARHPAADRCAMLDTRRTFLTTLALPGFAHARAGNHSAAVAAATVIVGTVLYGANQWRVANGVYDRYRTTTNYSRAPEYYDRANRLRSGARMALGAGAVLLVGDALLSRIEIRRFNAKIRNDLL